MRVIGKKVLARASPMRETHRDCSWAVKGRLERAPPGSSGHFQREAKLPAGREQIERLARESYWKGFLH